MLDKTVIPFKVPGVALSKPALGICVYDNSLPAFANNTLPAATAAAYSTESLPDLLGGSVVLSPSTMFDGLRDADLAGNTIEQAGEPIPYALAIGAEGPYFCFAKVPAVLHVRDTAYEVDLYVNPYGGAIMEPRDTSYFSWASSLDRYMLNPISDFVEVNSVVMPHSLTDTAASAAMSCKLMTLDDFSGPALLAMSSDDLEQAGAWITDAQETFAVPSPARWNVRAQLNPFTSQITEPALLASLQMLSRLDELAAAEAHQTRLLLINIVATLMSSYGLNDVVRLRAEHADWTTEEIADQYTTELRTSVTAFLTAMGVVSQTYTEEIAIVARAISGYLIAYAALTGWRLDELTKAERETCTIAVPATLRLLQASLQSFETRVTDRLVGISKSVNNTTAVSTAAAVASGIKLAL